MINIYFKITDNYQELIDTPRFLVFDSACSGVTGLRCLNFAHSIPTGGVLISFLMTTTLAAVTAPQTIVVQLGSTSTNGAAAYQFQASNPGESDSHTDFPSYSYQFGWPNFDQTSQTNQICIYSTGSACVTNFSYRPIYRIFQRPAYSTYSALQCVPINPITIGLTWFVFDWFDFGDWFHFLKELLW